MKRSHFLHTKLAYKIYKLEKRCKICWTIKWIICVHHKDENPWNNEKDNLQILCSSCHSRLHNTWKKLSDETKQKLSEKRMWIKNNMYWKFWIKHHLSKKVNQYSLEWEFIEKFNSFKEAYNKTWISFQNISLVCKWKRNHAWWFLWKLNKYSSF